MYWKALRVSIKKPAGVTRTYILDTAWDLIARAGADVSMQQIADASDVSRQSVYLHFKTRGGLLLALVKRADERFTIKEDFFTAMATPSPQKRLDACLRIWFDFVVNIHPVATDLIRLRKHDADAASAWEDRMNDLWAWERQLVESLAKDKALSKGWSIADATDYLWSSSSVQMFDLLTQDRNWSANKTSRVLRKVISQTLLG